MKRFTYWLVLGVVLILGSAIAWSQAERLRGIGRARSPADSPGDASARYPGESRVGALGRIEPSSQVLDIGAPLGDRVLRLLVKEGQKVAADEELAYLDSHDIVLAEKAEIAALLEEAKIRTAATKAHGRTNIRAAELHIQTVEQLEPLRIDSQKARLRSVEAESKRAEDEFNRAERLLADKAISREDHDRRQVEHQKQHELLTSARLALAELELNYPLSRDTAATALEEAKAALEQALASIPVQSLERKLALVEARLRQTIIFSPIAGQILKIHTRAGERIGNGPILNLGNTDEMHAVAEVYETDISRVRLGQSATVSCPALGQPIRGTVVRVGLMIHKNDVLNVDPAADADARVVEVRVRLDEPQRAAALTHLQVDVLIDVVKEAE